MHRFAIGWNRLRGADPRVSAGMTAAFLLIWILGIIVFFNVGDDPVGGLLIGLTCVYAADFFAGLRPDLPRLGGWAERVLGFLRIGTGFWLIYLVFAVALNYVRAQVHAAGVTAHTRACPPRAGARGQRY